jgi:hypothetical protein
MYNISFEIINYLKEFYLLEHNAIYFVESRPTFLRIMSPQSAGLKCKPSMKPACRWQQSINYMALYAEDRTLHFLSCMTPCKAFFLLHAGFLHGLLFNHKDRGNINVG